MGNVMSWYVSGVVQEELNADDIHIFACFVLCCVVRHAHSVFFALPEPLLRVNIVMRTPNISCVDIGQYVFFFIYGGF